MQNLLLYASLTVLIATPLLGQNLSVSTTVNGFAAPTEQSTSFYPDSNGNTNVTVVSTVQNPAANATYIFFDFETWSASNYSCKIGVQLGSPASTSNFFLHDDNGISMGPMWLGGNGQESNSKCAFSMAGSNISSSDGITYTVTLNINFKAPYNGAKYLWVNTTYDFQGNGTGWQYGNAAFNLGPRPASLTFFPSPTAFRLRRVRAKPVQRRHFPTPLAIKMASPPFSTQSSISVGTRSGFRAIRFIQMGRVISP